MTAKRSPLRMAAAGLMFAIGLTIIISATQQSDIANRDFIAYWASGKQIFAGQNPYDSASIMKLEHAVGYKGTKTFIMRNPPNALFLAVVAGLFSARISGILWALMLIAALMAIVRMLWDMNGRPSDRLHLLGYFFPPALCCILTGQIGILLALGFTLFLRFQATRPYLAGAALALCAVKPHLFGAFVVVLLAWSIQRRQLRLLGGAVTAILACCALALVLDPHAWHDYSLGMRRENIENDFVPSLSLLFRLAVHRSYLWLQFLPLALSLPWAVRYYWRRREEWSWTEHGPLLAAVGVLVAPYAWFNDEVLALPAVLAGIFATARINRSLLPYVAISSVALMEVFADVHTGSGLYLWTAPTWVAWYVYATRPARLAEPSSVAVSGAQSS